MGSVIPIYAREQVPGKESVCVLVSGIVNLIYCPNWDTSESQRRRQMLSWTGSWDDWTVSVRPGMCGLKLQIQ